MKVRRQEPLSVELVEAVEQVLRRRLGERGVTALHAVPRPDSAPVSIDAARRTRLAVAIYRARRDRDAVFGEIGVRFGDPAWDILLDLYRAYHEGKNVSVSSACIASSVPPTTGLRHLVELERRGLVGRRYDTIDKRRCFVSLSVSGVAMMDLWLSRLDDDDTMCASLR